MKFRNQAIKHGKSELDFRDRIPEFGFMRLRQIIGDSKADPPIPAIIPVCASSWWAGIKKGIYPSAIKISSNVTAWRVGDIRELIERINNQEEGE